MARLNPEAWDRIQTGFMIGCARPGSRCRHVQPDPKPEYWQAVVDAVERVAPRWGGQTEGDQAAEAAARRRLGRLRRRLGRRLGRR